MNSADNVVDLDQYRNNECLTVMESSESLDSNCDENYQSALKKRKGFHNKANWKKNINKKLRESGKSYTGWKRHENSCNKNNVHRPERQIKPTCHSEYCRKSKLRHCQSFTQEDRESLFKLFWNMTWKEKRIFVVNSCKMSKTKRPTKNDSARHRSYTLKYFLNKGNTKLRVCKQMFLNTLVIGEWTVNSWNKKSNCGMFEEPGEMQCNRSGNNKKEQTEFLMKYINSLPRLPSHYCRKYTQKNYLEPVNGGMLTVYKEYCKPCKEKAISPMSRTSFDNVIKKQNISFQRPKKDMCDTCLSYSLNQLSEEEYYKHQNNKVKARLEKEKDKNKSIDGECVFFEQDVQAVCPYIRASSAYYKRKLINHNFTVYEFPSKSVKCYWFSEVNADTQSSVFASCVIEYLNDFVKNSDKSCNPKLPIVIWSDGCTYQNRNSVLSNALSNFSVQNNVNVYQKFLEPGHTQMEVDSVHATIENAMRKCDGIHVPSQYAEITRAARKTPYEAILLNFDFFKRYDDPKVMKYNSIRPGKKKGDPCVTDIKALLYKPDGTIYYKLDFAENNYEILSVRPKKIVLPILTYAQLFEEPLKLTSQKFKDLQDLKKFIPSDYHYFYDNLPHN